MNERTWDEFLTDQAVSVCADQISPLEYLSDETRDELLRDTRNGLIAFLNYHAAAGREALIQALRDHTKPFPGEPQGDAPRQHRQHSSRPVLAGREVSPSIVEWLANQQLNQMIDKEQG